MKVIYLDNNATTQVAPEVVEAITPFLTGEYFNPSSMYEAARGPADAVAAARRKVARLLGNARSNEILFTSCATESNNTALFGTVAAIPERRHIITTSVEHPAVHNVARDLGEQEDLVTDTAARRLLCLVAIGSLGNHSQVRVVSQYLAAASGS